MFSVQKFAPCFGYQDYRRFWTGCMISTTAFHMQSIVLGWHMLEATNSAFWVGLVAFAYGLPFLILSPITGVLADRLKRQRVITVALALASFFSAGLALLTSLDQTLPWHIVVVSFLLGSAFVLYAPARSALLPNLVPGEILLNTSTITYSSTRLLGFVGTALAGVLVEFIGVGASLVVQAIVFALAIPVYKATGTKQVSPIQIEHRPGNLWHSIREAILYLRREQPSLLALAFLSLVVISVYTSFEKLIPVFARNVLATGASTFGLMAGVFHLGAALVGFAVAGQGQTLFKGPPVLLSSILFGGGLVIFVFIRQVELAVAFLLGLGAIVGVYLTLVNVFFESRPLDIVRGRVQSIWAMVWGLAPFVNLAAGASADYWGVTTTLAWGGVICVIFCLGMTLLGPSLREL